MRCLGNRDRLKGCGDAGPGEADIEAGASLSCQRPRFFYCAFEIKCFQARGVQMDISVQGGGENYVTLKTFFAGAYSS